jgi:hypothetical protein
MMGAGESVARSWCTYRLTTRTQTSVDLVSTPLRTLTFELHFLQAFLPPSPTHSFDQPFFVTLPRCFPTHSSPSFSVLLRCRCPQVSQQSYICLYLVCLPRTDAAPIAHRQDFDLAQNPVCNASLATFATVAASASGTLQALVTSSDTRTAASAGDAASGLAFAQQSFPDAVTAQDSEQRFGIYTDAGTAIEGGKDSLNEMGTAANDVVSKCQ